ncbi:MAG: cytosine permease [Actinomycetota bacterium]|nr:cytosine permease [Actinomycetota bacterium]
MSTADGRAQWNSDRGIEPVRLEERILGAFDLAVLWGDFGIGLLVLVTGALLVPGLGFLPALGAIVLGSVIGVGLLALAGMAGADHGIPTMVLFRPVLGARGSWVPSVLNALQLLGWTAVELWAMSFVADFVTQREFGFSARWLWLAIAAVFCTALALWGPLGVTRVWLERFGVWVVVAISLAITILVLTSPHLGAALRAPGHGGFPTFGPALDLVIAMPISWLPLVADYNRFARGARAAFVGTSIGYLIANVWLYALGAALVLTQGAQPSPAGIAAGILALAGGSIAGLLFLVGLLVGETDEAFADIYSGAVSLQNIFPDVPQRILAAAIAAVGTILAAWLTMERYENFLFLLGSIFVPLFGILIADYFLIRKRRIDLDQLYRGDGGTYWFNSGFRLIVLLPWLAGFLTYHWILPTGPVSWVHEVMTVIGTPLSVRLPWLAASVPSFLVAFSLTLVVVRLSSRSSPAIRGGP